MIEIGIIGLGLIGGSIAKALKSKIDVRIVAMNRSEQSLTMAFDEKIIDDYTLSDYSRFKNCDIIFICTPVDKITAFVEQLIPHIKASCIITDVGSTKGQIYEQMLKFEGINYIGGHPMAGSEQTSYVASREYLLENAFYILTPTPNVDKEAISNFEKLVKTIGAIPIIISPKEHDFAVAGISHVPHIIASALVNTVKYLDDGKNYMHTLAAGGFKDITRIASSSPEIWSSICFDNKDSILEVLRAFKSAIESYENKILTDDDKLYDMFSQSREYRNSFDTNNSYSQYKLYEIFVDVNDQPGSIATIATMLSVQNINIKNIGIINSREYSDGVLHIMFEHPEDKEKSIQLLQQLNFKVYNK